MFSLGSPLDDGLVYHLSMPFAIVIYFQKFSRYTLHIEGVASNRKDFVWWSKILHSRTHSNIVC